MLSSIVGNTESKILPYSCNTNLSRNIIKHNIRTSMNERTHFSIKIYLSHFILERVMFAACERWAGDKDRLLYWPQVLLATIAALLLHLGLCCSTGGHWGPKTLCLPLALTSASYLHLSPTVCAPGYIIVYVHLLQLFFRFFTQVHLLIDGSVEGQYITIYLNKTQLSAQCNFFKNSFANLHRRFQTHATHWLSIHDPHFQIVYFMLRNSGLFYKQFFSKMK